jgi:NAD(P) transhydrogenase
MNDQPLPYDVVIIGGGPAGHGAAMHAARSGQKTLLIEKEASVGGACVSRGTIPSKTLRETALALTGFRKKSADVCPISMGEDIQVASLMTQLVQRIGNIALLYRANPEKKKRIRLPN